MQLGGGMLLNVGAATISGTNSSVEMGTANLQRGSMTIASNGVANVGALSMPFNPFGASSLTISTGGAMRVTDSLDLGANANFQLSGTGYASVAGSFTNAGTASVTGGSITVAGATTNNASITLDSAGAISASFADIDGTGRFASTGIASITFNHLRQATLALQDETILATRPNGGPAGVSRVGALDFGSAEADTHWNLNDNDLIVDSGPASYVRGLLRIGRNGGAWDGGGLSSAFAAADPGHKALGYGANSVLGYTTFSGQSVGPNSILVKYTYTGDADLDGDVDGVDIGAWAINFTGELGGTGTKVWIQGDWDYDGDVDGVDAGLWAQNFTGELGGGGFASIVVNDPDITAGAAAILRGMGITVVPEPTFVAPAAALFLGLRLTSRQRKASGST
jgi:hypothetical protein